MNIRRLALAVPVAFAVSSLAMAGGHEANGSPEQLELGAELYAESCARCHGEAADGLREFGLSYPEFVARLEGMTQEMPDFTGYFYDDELAALHAYLNARAEEFAAQ